MNIFPIGTSTKILFGENSRKNLKKIIKDNEFPHILIIASSRSLLRKEIANMIIDLKRDFSVVVFDEVSPNPRIQDVQKCFRNHQHQDFTHIIGIGGGSAMDQAKAIAMCLSLQKDICEILLLKQTLPKRNNCLILLPTTSGTGAELSYGSILTDIEKGIKIGLRGINLASDHAIIDPELTYTLSIQDTMITGFDVLTHAIETFISKDSNMYIENNACYAIQNTFFALPILMRDSKNKEARKKLSFSSMIMGINLALSSTCLPHRMQYPIGAKTDTPHAVGLAAIYPAWLDHLLPYAESKLCTCSKWLNIHRENNNDYSNAKLFIENVNILINKIGLKTDLNKLGLNKLDIKILLDNITGNLDKDPSYINTKNIKKIYLNSYDRF